MDKTILDYREKSGAAEMHREHCPLDVDDWDQYDNKAGLAVEISDYAQKVKDSKDSETHASGRTSINLTCPAKEKLRSFLF